MRHPDTDFTTAVSAVLEIVAHQVSDAESAATILATSAAFAAIEAGISIEDLCERVRHDYAIASKARAKKLS